MSDKKTQEMQLEIQLDEALAQGTYANLSLVNHNENEFILDFVFVQPQATRAKVRSRIISSPRHAKQLMLALQENIKHYEQLYGVIEPPKPKTEAPVGEYQ